MPQRGADDEHRQQVRRCLDDRRRPLVHRVEQRVLAAAGRRWRSRSGQLGEHRHRHALLVAAPAPASNRSRRCAPGRRCATGGAGRDPGEAVGVQRVEVHDSSLGTIDAMSRRTPLGLSGHDSRRRQRDQPVPLVRPPAGGGRRLLHLDLPELLDRPPHPIPKLDPERARPGDGGRVHPRRASTFRAINGGPEHAGFTETISFSVTCADQSEVDHYWAPPWPTAVRSRCAGGSRTGSGCRGRSSPACSTS